MEMLYVWISLATVGLVVFVLMALIFNWILFGIKLIFAKLAYKGNIGFIFLRSKDNTLRMPLIVNLNNDSYKQTPTKIIPLTKGQFAGQTKFLGFPFAILDDNDVLHSCALGYLNSDNEFSLIKQSNEINAELLEAFIKQKASLSALQAFLDKNQIIMYLVIGAIAAAAFSAYFGYQLMSVNMPQIMDLLTQILLKVSG